MNFVRSSAAHPGGLPCWTGGICAVAVACCIVIILEGDLHRVYHERRSGPPRRRSSAPGSRLLCGNDRAPAEWPALPREIKQDRGSPTADARDCGSGRHLSRTDDAKSENRERAGVGTARNVLTLLGGGRDRALLRALKIVQSHAKLGGAPRALRVGQAALDAQRVHLAVERSQHGIAVQ